MKVTEVFNGNKMPKQNGTWVNYYTKIMPTSEAAKETRRVIETELFSLAQSLFIDLDLK